MKTKELKLQLTEEQVRLLRRALHEYDAVGEYEENQVTAILRQIA